MKIPMTNFPENTQISIRKLGLTNTIFLVMATTVIVILLSTLSFCLIAVNTESVTTIISMKLNNEYNHCTHLTIFRYISRAETQLHWVSAKSLMSFVYETVFAMYGTQCTELEARSITLAIYHSGISKKFEKTYSIYVSNATGQHAIINVVWLCFGDHHKGPP